MAIRYGDRSRVSTPVSDWLNPQAGIGFNKPLHSVVTAFTSGGVAHTKTSYTEIVASTSANCNLMMVDARVFVSGAETSWLVDIAVGAAGSESVIVPDLSVGLSGGGGPRIFPIFVPAGSRISARVQSNRLNDTRSFGFKLYQGPQFGLPQTVDVIGTNTATSRATIISSLNTWQELTASTSKRYQQLIICPGLNTSSVTSFNFYSVNMATGASGSETERASVPIFSHTSEIFLTTQRGVGLNISGNPGSTPIEVYWDDIPSGTRIAIRTDALSGQTSGFVIGVPYP